MAAGEIERAVLGDQAIDLVRGGAGEDVLEEVDQVKTNVAAEEVEGEGPAGRGFEDLLDGAADVAGGVQQGAVDVEEVDRELGDGFGPFGAVGRRKSLPR